MSKKDYTPGPVPPGNRPQAGTSYEEPGLPAGGEEPDQQLPALGQDLPPGEAAAGVDDRGVVGHLPADVRDGRERPRAGLEPVARPGHGAVVPGLPDRAPDRRGRCRRES